MEYGLLCKIKHFRDVFQVSGRTFDASLDFLELVHDRKDRLHRRVVDQIHLKLNKLKMHLLPIARKGLADVSDFASHLVAHQDNWGRVVFRA